MSEQIVLLPRVMAQTCISFTLCNSAPLLRSTFIRFSLLDDHLNYVFRPAIHTDVTKMCCFFSNLPYLSAPDNRHFVGRPAAPRLEFEKLT